jgi:predicted adenine nucleotide alpha hydrolase (AANH) superfamily ATPase
VRTLLHICCGPCAIYPVARLQEEGHAVTGYFFNPNIHPYQEFVRRRDAVSAFASSRGVELVIVSKYDLEGYLAAVLGKGPDRCEHCYRFRLSAAAAEARSKGFPAYTTSLLYSKYQKHDVIRGVAEEMARDFGIRFLYEDYRKGWTDGIRESRRLGLYRQQYCGCLFSERDRYQGR